MGRGVSAFPSSKIHYFALLVRYTALAYLALHLACISNNVASCVFAEPAIVTLHRAGYGKYVGSTWPEQLIMKSRMAIPDASHIRDAVRKGPP